MADSLAVRARVSYYAGQKLTMFRAALPEGRSLPVETWARRHRSATGLLWAHAAFVLVFGFAMGASTLTTVVGAVVLALAAALAAQPSLGQRGRAVTASLGLLTASSLLVHLSGGYIEFHFHFFVMLAVIALYQDWPPFLAAIGYVALEHGVMGTLMPHSIYNHPSAWAHPWQWAGIHATFVLAASAASLVNWRFNEIEHAQRLAEEEMGKQRLLLSEARFRSLVQNAGDLISIVEEDGTVRFAGPSHARVLGIDPIAATGQNVLESVHPDDRERMEQTLADLTAKPGQHRNLEIRMHHSDSSWRTLDAIATSLVDDPSVSGIVINARDITERKALERELAHQAFHDGLTGLPNRALFVDRLAHAIERANRDADDLSVLYVDLDQFKFINDSLGHKTGDHLLTAVAEQLRSCVRPGDTVSRIGGDEFTVLLEDADQTEATRVAERIARQFRSPLHVDTHELVVSASVGIACKSSLETRADDLLREAEVGMYAAKRSGKARHAVFDAGMQSNAWERLELEAELRRATEQHEFRLYYQPIVHMATGKAIEVEALLRWQHPTRGLVLPGQIIPLAEETGLILPISLWVLEEACRQLRAWHEELPATSALSICVNLSPKMLQHPTLVDDLVRIVDEAGVSPSSLKLEITEGVMMQNAQDATGTLARLREVGVRFAIDDFGTGYSSLSYLQYLPIDVLKIDRSFVARLGQGAESAALVRTIVGMAETLKLMVVGEGIETAEQMDSLRELGCEIGQGYYFSRPIPAEDARAWLLRESNSFHAADTGESESDPEAPNPAIAVA
jgi:diguanylate cyclase (GGDEF)-like protein/PAS domain S-box-containing protein